MKRNGSPEVMLYELYVRGYDRQRQPTNAEVVRTYNAVMRILEKHEKWREDEHIHGEMDKSFLYSFSGRYLVDKGKAQVAVHFHHPPKEKREGNPNVPANTPRDKELLVRIESVHQSTLETLVCEIRNTSSHFIEKKAGR